MRDLNLEYQDNNARKYSYDFDWLVRKYLLRAFAPHFRADGKTLEMGCYKGDMTAQVLSYFPKVVVLEGSSELGEIVRMRFAERVEVIISSFEDASLAEAYDQIFLVHTLEHVDDPLAILRKARSWLAPSGRLLLAVPNANALSRQIAVQMGWVEFNAAVTPAEAQHGHRRTYSMDTLLSQVRKAGLQVVARGGVVVKALANFQFDKAIAEGIVDEAYLDACNELGKTYPDLCASLYVVCAI